MASSAGFEVICRLVCNLLISYPKMEKKTHNCDGDDGLEFLHQYDNYFLKRDSRELRQCFFTPLSQSALNGHAHQQRQKTPQCVHSNCFCSETCSHSTKWCSPSSSLCLTGQLLFLRNLPDILHFLRLVIMTELFVCHSYEAQTGLQEHHRTFFLLNLCLKWRSRNHEIKKRIQTWFNNTFSSTGDEMAWEEDSRLLDFFFQSLY